ncbi:MAG: tRNA (guanosine(37)-N1)-methyltransferase TrmD [Candidatus Omnitrophica bacterium]|nr:tRNA (guanosine(37)-N1)-methyltransferase TrmD [Candidatus Omnitrophota bacterium]
MRIDVLTVFPEVFTPLNASIMKRAQEKKCVSFYLWNLRDFANNAYKQVDDAPFGGGRGMVLQCEPIFRGLQEIRKHNQTGYVILTSPQGELFNQEIACKLAEKPGLIFVCGHYEGVDERVITICDQELSIGDYILTGGELPTMVIIDTVVRLLPGVLPEGATDKESFAKGLLDWPCYTRPAEFQGMKVPEVLLSGDHAAVERWRQQQAEERTKQRRPDLYQKYLQRKKESTQ